MNATERIVETYFRVVRRCFTIPDVKVIKGNNRQIDLLAFRPETDQYFHVETSVTHQLEWQLSKETLISLADYKFFGKAKSNGNPSANTDAARGKTYQLQIDATYALYKIDPKKLIRVVCCWSFPKDSPAKVREGSKLKNYPDDQFELLSFRDSVIPGLQKAIGSSNYDDDISRIFSLFGQYQAQVDELSKNA